ncbi:MAG: AMP-binding protein [Bacilli bacterium]|nr:AMP-binding protein [Bacilli bacterium]
MTNFIRERIIYNAEKFPNKIAVRIIYENNIHEITYSRLINRIKQYKELLNDNSSKLVVLFLSTDIESYILIYSCFYYGVIPLIQTYNPKDSSYELLKGKFKKLSEYYPDISLGLILGHEHNNIYTLTNSNYENINKLKDVGLIQLSSGTTDFPKAIKTSFKALENNLLKCKKSWMINENSKIFSWLPISHCFGFLTGVLLPLYTSSEVTIINPKDFYENPNIWLKTVSRYKNSHAFLPNFALDHIINNLNLIKKDNEIIDLTSLEILGIGGEFITEKSVLNFYNNFNKYGLKYSAFKSVYGMSENSGIITTTDYLETLNFQKINKNNLFIPKNYDFTKNETTVANVGSIFENESILIDFNGDIVDKELYVGEIIISTNSLADGYLNDLYERKNNDDFIKYNNMNYFKTGDLGFLYKNHVYLLGRKKDIIIIRGKNFSPYVLENVISNNINIDDAKVVVSSISDDDNLYVLIDTHHRDVENIKEKLKNIMKDNFDFVIKDTNILIDYNFLPITSAKKIDRIQCKKIIMERDVQYEEDKSKN